MSVSPRAAFLSALIGGAALLSGLSVPGLALEPDIAAVSAASAAVDTPLPVTKAVTPTPVMGPRAEIVQPLPSEPADRDESIDYDTLAAAVADQDVPRDLDDQHRCLATGVYFESKGEPLSGQLAVAKVILNRTKSGRFPTDVCDVLTQRGQFSFVRGGRLPTVNADSRAWRTAVAVARVALDGHWDNPVPGALYFHARHVSPGWRLARLGSVGNHVFYR
ncbi:cell wall hydrolase [Sphingomonas sp. CJ99]